MRAGPAKTILGSAARAIFGADPTAITEAIEHGKYLRVVHFALIGLLPRRHGRHLNMSDERQVLLKTPDEIACNNLRVVKVELNADVWPVQLGDDAGRVLGTGEEIVRPVARIERFDQQRDVFRGGSIRRAREIVEHRHFGSGPLLRRYGAGHAVDLAATDRDCIVECLPEQREKFRFEPGHRGLTELAGRRCPPWGVDAEHREAMAIEFSAHRGWRGVVGELQLDRAKSCRGRCAEALDHRPFSEEIAEVGGEAGHFNDACRTIVTRISLAHFHPLTNHPERLNDMPANDAFHIAVIPGDGIGPEVMAPTLNILRQVQAMTAGLNFRFTEAPAGAGHYRDTGTSLPESTVKLCEQADAILLGACGLPNIRYPDNTEIMPQVELRMIFDLYAGVRPCRLIPGIPSPIVGAAQHGIDLVVIRESTEGLFASMGKGEVTETEARETLLITRRTSVRLFDFAFRLATRRKARGGRGKLVCVDKANAFKAFAFFRKLFDERAAHHPAIETERLYVDACSAMLVNRPWDFDVLVMENMFGDIISDLTAGLIGGMGVAPSADIGDKHAVFQPCHGTAPDIMGRGIANPTAMILSAALMLDWLAERHNHAAAAAAARTIEHAVDRAFAPGLKPCEFGGSDGTAAVTKAIGDALAV